MELLIEIMTKINQSFDMLEENPEYAIEMADSIKVFIGDKRLHHPGMDKLLDEHLKCCDRIKYVAANIIELGI